MLLQGGGPDRIVLLDATVAVKIVGRVGVVPERLKKADLPEKVCAACGASRSSGVANGLAIGSQRPLLLRRLPQTGADAAATAVSGLDERRACEAARVRPNADPLVTSCSSRGPRTPPSHGGNRGSNPLRDANSYNRLGRFYLPFARRGQNVWVVTVLVDRRRFRAACSLDR